MKPIFMPLIVCKLSVRFSMQLNCVVPSTFLVEAIARSSVRIDEVPIALSLVGQEMVTSSRRRGHTPQLGFHTCQCQGHRSEE